MSPSDLKKISKIINSISGRNVTEKRIKALNKAGYKTGDVEIMWNFGTVGTVKKVDGDYYAQIRYATGGRSRQNGYAVNACPVVKIWK